MTFLFLAFVCLLTFFSILAVGFKPKRNRIILYTMCVFVLVVTLFFGLKPKGYRFINQVQWLRQETGIAFTNIGMIHSEKVLGAIGITDSIVISAEVLPYSSKRFGRFITIVNKNGEEIFYVNQWNKNIFISLHGEKSVLPAEVYLPNALSADTMRRVTIGIGSESIWLESDKAKKVTTKLPSGLQSHFLENCTLLIGYGASGKNPWNGELHKLTLSNGCSRYTEDSLYLAASGTKQVCTNSIAEFLFVKTSDRRIINQRGGSWDLIIPLFPKMFQYDWPQPLTRKFLFFKHSDRNTKIDLFVNLLGFIPLGAVFLLLFSTFHQTRRKAFLFTFTIALATSTSIEFIQILIPTRISQVSDIVLNVTGACIGAISILILQWFMMLKKDQKLS